MLKIDLDKNKKYILACSYGPDSMALFDLLLKNNYDFVVCFLNYKTRAESDIEEEKITTFCKAFSKKLYMRGFNKSVSKYLALIQGVVSTKLSPNTNILSLTFNAGHMLASQ